MTKKLLEKFDINKNEIKLILFCSLIIIIISSIWLLYGRLNTPPNYYFLGINSISPGDTYVYLSYTQQIKQSGFFLNDLFTSEKQNYASFSIFWFLAGIMAKILNLSSLFAYQLIRILLIPAFLFLSYFFISFFFNEKIKRKVCFIFLISSSGLGFLLSPFIGNFYEFRRGYFNWPMDLWAAEANTFMTLYQSPLKIASLSLIILTFLFFLLAVKENNLKYSLGAGIAGLFLIQFHPFHAATIYCVLFAFSVYLFIKNKNYKTLKHFLLFGFLSFPAVLYYWYLISFDQSTAIKYQQNLCLTPSLIMTLISYGLLLPLLLVGLIYFLKNKFWLDEKKSFLVIWLITQLMLIYSPLKFQRRLTEGLHIIIVILAIYGLFYFYDKFKTLYGQKFESFVKNYAIIFVFIYILFFTPSNLSLVATDLRLDYSRPSFLYFAQNKVSALTWLKNNSTPGQVVFSHQANGNLLPGLIGRPVYAGHDVETLFFDRKIKEISWFFENNFEDNKKSDFLKKNQIEYLFYSDQEKNLGDFNPDEKKYLKLIYQNPEVKIYRVIY